MELRDFLIGWDPTKIEEIWTRTFRLFTYTGTRGATTAAMSGIDIALWDIFCKSVNKPIYQLLGGSVRNEIPLYTHPPEPDEDIALAIENAKEILLKPGDNFHVYRGLRHQMIALEDTELFEFSTQHFDSDSYRIEKGD